MIKPNVAYKLFTDNTRRRIKVHAYCSLATGNLIWIKSGCRRWKSWQEAIAHYAGGGRYRNPYWRKIQNSEVYTKFDLGPVRYPDLWNRDSHMLAIARCAARVYRWQQRRKKKRVRR